MFRELRRPEAEAVMVLAGQNQSLHAGGLGSLHDLFRAEISGVEDGFRLITVAPFLVGERVHSEMNKAIKFQLMPRELARARHRADRRGRLYGGSGAAKRDNNCGQHKFKT